MKSIKWHENFWYDIEKMTNSIQSMISNIKFHAQEIERIIERSLDGRENDRIFSLELSRSYNYKT